MRKFKILIISILAIITTNELKSQEQIITLKKAIELSNENYPKLKAGRLNIEQQKILKSTAYDFGTTTISTGQDGIKNGNAESITNFGIAQNDIDIFGILVNNKLQKSELKLAEVELEVVENQLDLEVTKAYNQLLYFINSLEVYEQIDSVYSDFVKVAQLRFETGESSKLEYLTALAQYRELATKITQMRGNIQAAKYKLNQFMLIEDDFSIDTQSDFGLDFTPVTAELSVANNKTIALLTEKTNIANNLWQQQRSQWFPKLSIGYKNLTINDMSGFYSYEVGLSFSLFNGQQPKTKSAKMQVAIENENLRTATLELEALLNQLLAKYTNLIVVQKYYIEEALPLADEQIKASTLAYQLGEVDYLKFIQSAESSLTIKLNYIKSNFELRNIQAEIKYLTE